VGNFSEYRDRDTLLKAANGDPTVKVWLYDPLQPGDLATSDWFAEHYTADEAFGEALHNAMLDYGCTYAVYQYDLQGPWRLVTLDGDALRERQFPNKEAAEMVAIHNG